MAIKLKTLTPLWTGGEDGKVDRIHETGILGSLRWWYEVIVRGLDGHACDPSQGECRFDDDKYAKSRATNERKRLQDAGLCDVCQVFGATGWRRRFRLEVVAHSLSDAPIQRTIKADRTYKDNKGKTHTPYFRDPTQASPAPNTPKQREFTIKIHSLSPDFPSKAIAALVQFLADWAAIGAKTQMGFGVIGLEGGRVDTRPLFEWLEKCPKAVAGSSVPGDLPSLKNIFLARIVPKDGGKFSEQDTFNLKYDLRQLFRGQKNKDLRHFIMGTIKEGRIAAKVKPSRPYDHGDKKAIRVWGWIPEKADAYRNGWDREKVVEKIHERLKNTYQLDVWRELNSARDTENPNNNCAKSFLRSLLCLEK